jgi:uncharacterized protein involved in exopolysaccharide biosynthesis
VSKQREQQLQSALASQKERVLMLNKQRDEITLLRRDIESAQRSFDILSQRASQSNVESQTNQTNIAILNPAVAPTSAAKPRKLLNILISLFAGSLLGIGLALALELANRHVRSAYDLLETLEIPVLASIGSAAGMFKPNAAGTPAKTSVPGVAT